MNNSKIPMKLSIVIPTFNRPNDLRDLLFSILRQTKLPKEVVIVDDSENFRTRDLIEQVLKHFSKRGIVLKYLHNLTRSSISAARNQGTMHTTGEVILFLDDDVVIEKEYIEEILKIYRNYPNAIGVSGYIMNTPKLEDLSAKSLNQLRRIFFLYHYEKNQCRVLPSGTNTYPNQITRIIGCQLLYTINASFKSEVLKENKFDENLKRYSYTEDVDLSYRLFKKYPNSLYMTPYAKVFHKSSKAQRLSVELRTYTESINRTYFFHKNIRQTLLNKLIFIWSNIGRIFFLSVMIFKHVLSLKKSARARIRYIHIVVKSYIYVLKHLKEIKSGSLKFFEEMF